MNIHQLNKYFIFIIFVQTLLASSSFRQLTQAKILTNPYRTPQSLKYCHNSKINLITSNDRSLNYNFYSSLNAYFSTQTNQLSSAVLNNDTSIINNQIQKITNFSLIAYASPFIVGGSATLLIGIFFCFFCLCPKTCPPKSCRKQAQLLYTKRQLLFPSVCTVITSLIVISLSIIGIFYSLSIKNSIQTVQCGISMVYDDLLNGNITNSQLSYFSGFMQLNGLTNQSIMNINNNFSSINISSIKSSFSQNTMNLLSDLHLLGDGNNKNTSFSLNYSYPTPMSPMNVQSSFGRILGNPNDQNSLSGTFYKIALQVNSSFFSFLSTLKNTQTIISSQLSILNTKFADFSSYFKYRNQNINILLNKVDNYKPALNTATYSFFGYLIGISVLSIIGISTIIFCKKLKWIKVIYGSCFLLWIGTIASFIISCFIVILIPFVFLQCRVANQSFASSLGFSNFMSTLNNFGIPNNDTLILSSCMNDQGNFLSNSVNIANITQNLTNSLNNIVDASNSINQQYKSLTDILSNTSTTIYNYNRGYINDIIYQFNSRTWFQNVSTRQQYISSCGTDSVYSRYNFVPSTNNQSLSIIPCAVNTSLANNCTTIDTCSQGCIDMNDIMWNQLNSDTYSASIKKVFSGNCGSLISTQFVNTYKNWFLPRTNKNIGIQSVLDRFSAPSNSVQSDSNIILSNLNSVSNLTKLNLNSIINQLNQLIDSKAGIISGTNCAAVGQDVTFVKDSICITVFNNIFILLIVIGIISYFSLCGMCCFVCSGYRHTRQNQKYAQMQVKQEVKMQKKSVPQKSYTQSEQESNNNNNNL